MTLHSKFFRFVSSVCCGILIALPLQNGYVSSAAPDAATTLANSLRALQDGENAAPRDHWDPKYVEAQFGSDPARTSAWVRDHTYWIPYHGILRGPVGVLMDRQGDSLDRALLLATMLRDEGQAVRLAHGTIAAAQADRMLATLLTRRMLRELDAARPPRPIEDLSATATKYGLDPVTVRRTVAAQQTARAAQKAQFQALSGEMRRLMTAAGVAPVGDDASNLTHALTALADHWWVETQAGGSWHAFDLLSSDPSKPLAVADRTIDLTSIPAGLYHQVTIRVVIESWAAGVTSEKAALEQTFQPAQTIGMPIALSFTGGSPLKALPAPGQDVAMTYRTYAMGQHEWTPSLDLGKQHVVQNAITDTGNLTVPSNDTDVLAVAKGVTHGLAGAIDDVFGSGPPAAAPPVSAGASTLSAAWIEYRIAAPGEPVQTVRRQIFDLPGPAARAANSTTWKIDDAETLTRSLSLMMSTDILPVTCALAPQFVQHLSRRTVLANGSVARDILGGKIADDLEGAQTAGGRMVNPGTSLYDLAMRRLNSSPLAPFIYVDRPDILTRHFFVAARGNTFVPTGSTDIVANGVGVDPTGPSRFQMAVAQGVYDTSGEAVLYSTKPNAGNTAWAYGAGGDWVTLARPGDAALPTLQLGADVRARITAALASNHIVIVPRSRVSVGGGSFAGWWQVDKASGETLGMGETGWGQELAEYVVVMIGWAFVSNWLYCKLAPGGPGGSPIVATNVIHSTARGGRVFDLFETPVEARGDNCLLQAFLFTGLGMMAGGMGAGMGEGSGEPGEAGGSLPEEPVDPNAKTQPVPAVGGGEPGGGAAGGGGTGGGGTGGGGGEGSGAGGGRPRGPGTTNPGPEEAAKFSDAKRKYSQLFDSPDVLGRYQAIKEMLRNQPGPMETWEAEQLDRDIQQLKDQRAGRGFSDPSPDAPPGQANRTQVVVGDPTVNPDGKTQPVPTLGAGGTGGEAIPPTLRSPGGGASGSGAGQGGGSGSGTTGSGTPTLPGLSPCAPYCGPSSTPTLVGLGGAIGALGGS